jgi:hypothetical protein
MAIVVKPKAAKPVADIKDGTYQASVTNITQFVNTYGERIGFEFTIHGSEFDGQKVMRSADRLLWARQSPESNRGRIVYARPAGKSGAVRQVKQAGRWWPLRRVTRATTTNRTQPSNRWVFCWLVLG